MAVASSASASSGVLEINQACAATGCFPGDAPGLPVTIDGSAGRSYRLTSDLIVPDENTDGIRILSNDVGIELNGFAIIRSGCEAAASDCTPSSGSGSGIEVNSTSTRALSVENGSITGMGRYGVFLGSQAQVTRLRVRWNRLDGIWVSGGSTVSGNTAYQNGADGIETAEGSTVSGNTAHQNGSEGIEVVASTVSGNTVFNNRRDGIRAGLGSTVSGNTAHGNWSDGIDCGPGCIVRGNAVRLNLSYGLNLGDDSAYSHNVVTNNQTGPVTGTGTSRGGNFCAGTGTVSSFCP